MFTKSLSCVFHVSWLQTLGGSLALASPIADVNCVLLASNTIVNIASVEGQWHVSKF